MNKTFLQSSVSVLMVLVMLRPAAASDLERSTVTQVVRDVVVLKPGQKGGKPVKVNDIFAVPEVMKTGTDSRVEMVAEDDTVTRVGANTLFSFEPMKREINLQKGSVLFNSPTGKGGGNIKTAAATASVLGTSLIVTTTKNGGFKVLLLEGHGAVKTPKGRFRRLNAGQMVYAMPGGDLSGVLSFSLKQQVGAARLVNGFKKPLASMGKIEKAIAKQEKDIAKGQLVETGLLASDQPNQVFQVDVNAREVLVSEPQQEHDDGYHSGGGLAQALGTNASVTTRALDPSRTFVTNVNELQALLPGLVDSLATAGIPVPPSFTLFPAFNLTIDSPQIDLRPYSPTVPFVFAAVEDITINQSVSIDGTTIPVVSFLAGSQFQLASGANLTISTPDLLIGLAGTRKILLSDSVIQNQYAGGSLEVLAPALSLTGDSAIRADGRLTLKLSSGQLNITGDFTPGATSAGLTSANGVVDVTVATNINLTDANIQGTGVTIRGERSLTANNVRFAAVTAGAPTGKVTLKLSTTTPPVPVGPGFNLLSLSQVQFAARDVSLQARTLVLRDVDFAGGSNVVLRSANGRLAPMPNTNRPVSLGDVNFIRNVTYGGAPAQNAVATGSIRIR